MNLKEFYELLEKHDWFYMFSDSLIEYHKGVQYDNFLLNTIKNSDEPDKYLSLYNNFQDHHFSGPAYKNDKKPSPKQPEEN